MGTHEPDARILVLYHAGCHDGACAAWIVKSVWKDAELVPVRYQEPPPDVTGRDVMIVDFSYPRETLLAMHEQANRLHVIDHHKTAQAELAGLPFCTFDLERSGAGLTWCVLKEESTMPKIVRYIEDRDLWRFALFDSRDINAFIQSFPPDPNIYDELNDELNSYLTHCAVAGAAINRATRQAVDRQNAAAVWYHTPHGELPVVNATHAISETTGALAERGPGVAVSWRHDGERYCYSLRARDNAPEGTDVGALARQHGGGGHPGAAGFSSYQAPWELEGWVSGHLVEQEDGEA